jgi:VWFA-related protein
MLFKSCGFVFGILCLSVLLAVPCVAQTSNQAAQEGIRIDVPTAPHLRIENQFGNVTADIWQEKYVAVSAIQEGSEVPFIRSPIVVDNRTKLLMVSVVRRPGDPPGAIRLQVRMPEDAHCEIITGEGAIVVRGMPSSASIQSTSGDIRAELASPVNADISARSQSGTISSELSAPLSADGHLLQVRLGTNRSVLKINSNSGKISLGLLNGPNEGREASAPRLAGLESPLKGAGIPANKSDNEEVSEGDVIRVDSQLATINMSVIDRNTNRGIVNLSQSDFQLFEDGVTQRILQFEASSAPFDLILLIDVSGSTREVVKLIRSAALRFVDSARPSDRIAIVSFAGQPTLVAPLTLDRKILRERVAAIETAAGDTKVYDAIDFALKQLVKEISGSRRTAIVLMSDGLDGNIPGVQGDGSKLSYEDLLNKVREFDGVLYTLWLNTEYEALSPLDTQPEAFDAGHDRMNEMAEAGGGLFYEVERLEDLAGAYERVVADLGTVYSLAYRPTNKTRDGKWRAIRVSINRPYAVARGKHGYYAN